MLRTVAWPLICVFASLAAPRVEGRDAASPATGPEPVKLDPSRAVKQEGSDLLWYDARELTIEGKGWAETADSFYTRLPAKAEKVVPSGVWKNSRSSAGVAVRLVTDSKRIEASWDGGGGMQHMAATGNSGLDLYVRTEDGWEFRGVGVPQTKRTTAALAKDLPGKTDEYIIYLPLYHSVTELLIGVEPASLLAPAPARPEDKVLPIVFYGTSITQGGCASRAGMCHTAMLGRWLDRPVINLGFSGSGRMDMPMAELMCELDACLYVLECLPNMTTEMVGERVQPFVEFLRKTRPDTPILLVENPIKPAHNAGNRALREVYAALNKAGIKGLHYLAGEPQLAGQENGTVDGVHPTDLGFYRMAVVYRPVLTEILNTGR